MGRPVLLSDELVADARLVGEVAKRSISSQIEFWARLGRVVETVLDNKTVLLRHKRSRGAVPLAECLRPRSKRERVSEFRAFRATVPYPHYEAVPGRKGYFTRIEDDGRRTLGRRVGHHFVPSADE